MGWGVGEQDDAGGANQSFPSVTVTTVLEYLHTRSGGPMERIGLVMRQEAHPISGRDPPIPFLKSNMPIITSLASRRFSFPAFLGSPGWGRPDHTGGDKNLLPVSILHAGVAGDVEDGYVLLELLNLQLDVLS